MQNLNEIGRLKPTLKTKLKCLVGFHVHYTVSDDLKQKFDSIHEEIKANPEKAFAELTAIRCRYCDYLYAGKLSDWLES